MSEPIKTLKELITRLQAMERQRPDAMINVVNDLYGFTIVNVTYDPSDNWVVLELTEQG